MTTSPVRPITPGKWQGRRRPEWRVSKPQMSFPSCPPQSECPVQWASSSKLLFLQTELSIRRPFCKRCYYQQSDSQDLIWGTGPSTQSNWLFWHARRHPSHCEIENGRWKHLNNWMASRRCHYKGSQLCTHSYAHHAGLPALVSIRLSCHWLTTTIPIPEDLIAWLCAYYVSLWSQS